MQQIVWNELHFTPIYTVHAFKKINVLRVYYTYGYGRAMLTATGVLGLRLQAYYAYGYGRITATTTGVLQAYYGLAAGCKLTSGHYNRER